MTLVRFWTVILLFHAVLGGVSLWLARGWSRRVREPHGPMAWGLALCRDAATFAGLALVWGALVTQLGPDSAFLYLRLLAQALFGEALLLIAWAAALHARRRHGLRAGLLSVAALALLAVYGHAYHVAPRDLQVRHHQLDLAGGAPLARSLRILHLTDIQTPEVGAYEERVLREGLAHKPDLIVFTGDYIHERLAPTGARAAADFRALLRRVELAAPLGVYATDGDAGAACDTIFAGTGVTCLVDAAARIPVPGGRGLALVGLATSTSRTHSAAPLLSLLDSAPPGDLRVVMGHAPDFVTALAGRGQVDLALAGHTHGGQVVLPWLGPVVTFSRLPRRFAADLHEYEGLPLHVSRGVGMERGAAPQIRFLCPPEICLIDVRYRP